MVSIKDLKKGDTVRLAHSGWKAVLMEKPGSRMYVLADVYGFEHEMGSVYCHDIAMVETSTGVWEGVEKTKQQLALKKKVGEW